MSCHHVHQTRKTVDTNDSNFPGVHHPAGNRVWGDLGRCPLRFANDFSDAAGFLDDCTTAGESAWLLFGPYVRSVTVVSEEQHRRQQAECNYIAAKVEKVLTSISGCGQAAAYMPRTATLSCTPNTSSGSPDSLPPVRLNLTRRLAFIFFWHSL